MPLDDTRLAAIRDCCVRLLGLRMLLRQQAARLDAEISRARRDYGFTPFAEGGEDGIVAPEIDQDRAARAG